MTPEIVELSDASSQQTPVYSLYNFRFIISQCNLTGLIPLEEAALQSHSTVTEMDVEPELNQNGYIKATERALKFFQDIDKSSVRKLYHLYKPDFELFKYSISEFM